LIIAEGAMIELQARKAVTVCTALPKLTASLIGSNNILTFQHKEVKTKQNSKKATSTGNN
jgi:hypothetical protein